MRVLVGAWNPIDVAMISLLLYKNGIEPVYFSKEGLAEFVKAVSDGKSNLYLVHGDFDATEKIKSVHPSAKMECDGQVDAAVLHHIIDEEKAEAYLKAPVVTFSACSSSTLHRHRWASMPKRIWSFDPIERAELFTPRLLLPFLYGMPQDEFLTLTQSRKWGSGRIANLEAKWKDERIAKFREKHKNSRFYGNEVYLEGNEVLRVLAENDFLFSFRDTAGISWSLIEGMNCGAVPVYPKSALRGGIKRYLDEMTCITYTSLDSINFDVDAEKMGRAAMERVASLGTLDQCVKSVGEYFARLS